MQTRRLINKLEEMGYRFNGETERTRCFKKGTHRLYIVKRDELDEKTVRSLLSQAGAQREEIEKFVHICNL